MEEDIKNAEHFINSIKTDKEYKEENDWHGYYNKEIVELARMLEHILSDYKRVLKENEILKEEKEQAWEEWNNLERGSYETKQKLKQQIKELQKENEEAKAIEKNYNMLKEYYKEQNEVNARFIPVKKVKAKIEKEIKYHGKNILDIENITMLKGKTAKEEAEIEFNKYAIVVLKKMLQELLESEE